MGYIIVGWNMPMDAAILTDKDGNNLVFEENKEAGEYAKENCAWHYAVVEV